MKITLLLLVLNIYISNVFADVNTEVDLFVKTILQKDKIPTLQDYHKFYGEGAEGELSILTKYCKRKDWTPVNTNKKCISYVNDSYSKKDEVKSIYLKKIRKLLPLSPKTVKIDKVISNTEKEMLKHELVYVKIDNDNVVFFRPIDANSKGAFGIISVSSINETPINKLMKKHDCN